MIASNIESKHQFNTLYHQKVKVAIPFALPEEVSYMLNDKEKCIVTPNWLVRYEILTLIL